MLVGTEPPVFRRIAPPREVELQALVERVAERIGRCGIPSFLELDPAAGGPIDDLLGHSITYRVTVGPRAGQKVFSLQTMPVREEGPTGREETLTVALGARALAQASLF